MQNSQPLHRMVFNRRVVGEINAVLRGWCGYFHYGNNTRVFGKVQ
jgi:hypothetical protein